MIYAYDLFFTDKIACCMDDTVFIFSLARVTPSSKIQNKNR